jgi:hypothetical protein
MYSTYDMQLIIAGTQYTDNVEGVLYSTIVKYVIVLEICSNITSNKKNAGSLTVQQGRCE